MNAIVIPFGNQNIIFDDKQCNLLCYGKATYRILAGLLDSIQTNIPTKKLLVKYQHDLPDGMFSAYLCGCQDLDILEDVPKLIRNRLRDDNYISKDELSTTLTLLQMCNDGFCDEGILYDHLYEKYDVLEEKFGVRSHDEDTDDWDVASYYSRKLSKFYKPFANKNIFYIIDLNTSKILDPSPLLRMANTIGVHFVVNAVEGSVTKDLVDLCGLRIITESTNSEELALLGCNESIAANKYALIDQS